MDNKDIGTPMTSRANNPDADAAKKKKIKWAIIGVLIVIALVLVITLPIVLTRGGGGDGPAPIQGYNVYQLNTSSLTSIQYKFAGNISGPATLPQASKSFMKELGLDTSHLSVNS